MSASDHGRQFISKIGDLISGMPSDECTGEAPTCDDLHSLQRDILDWINVSGLADNPVYGDVAALEPYPVHWIAGSDSERREIDRRRGFLEELARRVGIAVRMIESRRTERTKRTRRWSRRRSGYISSREKKILEIIKRPGVEGLKYCRILDDEGVKAPLAWIDEGWPGNYVKAYTLKGQIDWTKRIQDEKSRVLKKATLQAELPNSSNSSVTSKSHLS